jgi:hypothetical protein
MAHMYELVLPPWGFSYADITTDMLVATATNDPVHSRRFAEYIGLLNPRARVRIERNGGRTFALLRLGELLQELLAGEPQPNERASVAAVQTEQIE